MTKNKILLLISLLILIMLSGCQLLGVRSIVRDEIKTTFADIGDITKKENMKEISQEIVDKIQESQESPITGNLLVDLILVLLGLKTGSTGLSMLNKKNKIKSFLKKKRRN